MLIGPLTHIKTLLRDGTPIYTIDFSRPGAIERFNSEEKEWWSVQPDQYRGKFPGP